MLLREIVSSVLLGGGLLAGAASAQVPQAAIPADGITVDMMPISQEQLTSCRQQASSQLTDEQKTLHDREHGQDKDKMAQGAIAGTTGAVTSAISRRGGGWWGYGNNNGANTAAATGSTERTNRNSADVASTTATSQQVGVDAYQQCVLGIKGSAYVAYRAAHPLNGVPAATPVSQPAMAATSIPPMPLNAANPAIQDEGDGKHFVLTPPGESSSKEVTLAPGSKNAYIDASTGDKYIAMPDGSIKKIAHAKKTASK